MKTKKIMTSFIAIILAITSFALTAGAATVNNVSVTVRALGANTLISSAVKTTTATTYDEFSWTDGDMNSLNVWIADSSKDIIGPKVSVAKGAGYTKIRYTNDEGLTFVKGATAYMYAEQFNVFACNLYGSARFS